MRRMRLVGMGLVLNSCQAPPVGPGWQQLFGYADESMQTFEIRAYGFPFVPIAIGTDTLWAPFDTGNMVGLTIATGVSASAVGTQHDSVSVFEFFHENLPGPGRSRDAAGH
ncbi:MAG: hypothetical protein BMS9Abin29_0738 [Gemmatimonadota bacterium]|nr:MAG: hypothetical protein BMS9Abin29_0738 [Gemmatimonadota bacterium]